MKFYFTTVSHNAFYLVNLILMLIWCIFFGFFQSALAKQENMEMRLQEVQRNLEHSKGKVAQLQEKL